MSDYRGYRIIQCFLVQSNMVTVPHNMVDLERKLDYRGVGLQRFHCMYTILYVGMYLSEQYHSISLVLNYCLCICTYVLRMCVCMYVCLYALESCLLNQGENCSMSVKFQYFRQVSCGLRTCMSSQCRVVAHRGSLCQLFNCSEWRPLGCYVAQLLSTI